jgi:hypothetical protein
MIKHNISNMLLIIALASLLFLGVSLPVLAADPTTSVHVVKYASDGTTVVNETTVDYLWMEANLPVQGDGTTHYYHQGPVFDESMDKWDPEETTNFKDKGAVRGTDIKDLCDLVGGMSLNDTVRICAIDGYCVQFGYENVYQPQDRQGPIVLSWYSVEDGTIGQQQESGYPPRYFEAMQVVFMPKTTNAEGLYVFGNWDMYECLPDEAQHFYSELYPSTNGLSLKWANEIAIYPEGAPIVTQEGATLTPTSTGGESSSGSNSLPLVIGLSAAAVIVLLAVVLVVRRRNS